MKRVLFFVMIMASSFAGDVFCQATLPVSRTTWNGSPPTGWIDSGTGSYLTSFACTGNNMGRLDDDNDYYSVYFTVVDQQIIEVNYTLKGASFSGGDFDVEYSHNGTAWTNLASYNTMSGSCVTFQHTYTASGTNSYVRFYYTDKVTGNVGLDDVNIDIQVPAPVTLTTFTAKAMETNTVALHWTTASEENNDYFAIEHSADGRTFDQLDYVFGAGTTAEMHHYQFMHKEAARGSNYYRLRQVDFDGTFSFSEIKVVVLEDQSEVSIQPTLAQENVEVFISQTLANDGYLEVINQLGQVMIRTIFPANSNQMTLNINDLDSGHYFVRINSADGIKSARFVKL